RVERLNDEYLEKQIRNGTRDLSHYEEKDVVLQQVEDVFNEMGGEGLNRVMTRFFGEFRNLASDPDSEAVRQSVRESSKALVNTFHVLRNGAKDVQNHIDSRLEGYAKEVNMLADNIRDLNVRIKQTGAGGAEPNDLMDQRDLATKKLAALIDISV